MKPENFTELSNQELLEKKTKIKTNNIINAVLIGFFVGVTTYSAIKHGFGFFTFLPLIFVYFIVKNRKNTNELEKEIKSRNLEQEQS